MAEIKKKVDIEVDSSKLEKALKSIDGMDKILKSILKTNKDLLKLFSTSLKEQNQSLEIEKKKLNILKMEEDSVKRINKLRQEQSFQKELRDLENQKPSGFIAKLQQAQRYKGAVGGIQMMADYEQEESENRLADYDNDIAIKQQEYKDLQDQLDALQTKSNEYQEMQDKGKTLTPEQEQEWKEIGSQIPQKEQQVQEKGQDLKDTQKARSAEIGQAKAAAGKYAAMAAAAQKLQAVTEKLGKAVLNLIVAPFKALNEGIKEAVHSFIDLRSGIATFNASTSLITNTAAREQQLKYGLDSAQNFAFTRAKEMLNIQSDEDLMYMNADQRNRLLAYMDKYANWYADLEASGVLEDIQEMQLEFEELKQEIAMEFLQWVAENKDTIMACIKGIFEVIKWVADGIMNLVSFFTGTKKTDYNLYSSADASDRINNTNNNQKITNININANTTNNATGVLGSQEALEQFNKENWSQLAKQVVGAVGG